MRPEVAKLSADNEELRRQLEFDARQFVALLQNLSLLTECWALCVSALGYSLDCCGRGAALIWRSNWSL